MYSSYHSVRAWQTHQQAATAAEEALQRDLRAARRRVQTVVVKRMRFGLAVSGGSTRPSTLRGVGP